MFEDDLLDLSDDMAVFDGLSTLVITFQTSSTNLNFETGKSQFEIKEITCENCLIRDAKNRNSQSVHQLRDRSQQNDQFNKLDVVIEVPWNELFKELKQGGTIYDPRRDRKWKFTAFDVCTLESRTRFGCLDYV